ncbi:MAG: AMP-binding protein, partial [Desulfamplus sp.]|nr:AMP-binding protein [Desulfamplus sp.]
EMEPVPIGVAGNLWVGGVGVGLGYLNQPELTQKAFIRDPFHADNKDSDPGGANSYPDRANSDPDGTHIHTDGPDSYAGIHTPISKRLYRTGDLAQYLPDGNILFLGRSDHQVKIRGFRIELEEIEAAISRHPMVREQVVTARSMKPEGTSQSNAPGTSESAPASPRDQSDAMALVAYVVFHEADQTRRKDNDHIRGKNNDQTRRKNNDRIQDKNHVSARETGHQAIEELRIHLAGQLPAYMVPSAIVALPEMPLTSNGKIDRRALPQPTETLTGSSAPFALPRSDTERELLEVMAEVLARPGMGIHDNYFSLGGDSIQAIQVTARIQMRGYTLKLRDIFQYPTVAELAPRLSRRTRQIDQGWVSGPVHPTPIQSWLLSQDRNLINHYNQAVMLTFDASLDVPALEAALGAVMLHHDALRMTINTDMEYLRMKDRALENQALKDRGFGGGAPEDRALDDGESKNQGMELVIQEPEAIKPRVSVIPFNPDRDLESLFSEMAPALHSSFDLENGPLVKTILFQGNHGDEQHHFQPDKLIVIIHHLSVDAVSWPIILNDLFTAYSAHRQGQGIQLPAKTHPFSHWTAQLGIMAENAASDSPLPMFTREIQYWEEVAKEPRMILPGQNKNHGLHGDAACMEITLPARDTAILTGRAQEAYHTDMNDLILTALTRALKHWAGIDNIMVALEGHGRDDLPAPDGTLWESDVDISRTVGWFTVEYPVLLKWTDGMTGLQIKSIKESLRRVPNRGMTFGIVKPVLETNVQRRLEPEISFNYLGAVDGDHAIISRGGGAPAEMGTLSRVEALPHKDLIHPKMKRAHAMEMEAEIRQNRLHIQIYYNPDRFGEDSMQELISILKGALIEIIDHCAGKEESEVTPWDLTWPHLTLPQFDVLMEQQGMKPSMLQDIYPLA